MESQRRTTADPFVDLAAELPGIEDHLGLAIRLHPRPGAPSPEDSSVGGPLLWSVGEPWSTCGAEKYDFLGHLGVLALTEALAC
jgi:hypothetical protein